jgi:hypothetical protein
VKRKAKNPNMMPGLYSLVYGHISKLYAACLSRESYTLQQSECLIANLQMWILVLADARRVIDTATYRRKADTWNRPWAPNPRHHRSIEAAFDLTGVLMLLSTAFNGNVPVVYQPREALDCFLRPPNGRPDAHWNVHAPQLRPPQTRRPHRRQAVCR